MASIKELIQSIESGDSSFDEKLAAINQMEETLIAMRNNEEQAVNDNVELIVEAIKVMEKKVNDQLEIAKSIVPEKGDKGDRGLDGAPGRDGVNGRDGRDGKDGQNGQDGADGVSVTDAKIDFDGSLIITLSTGREINVGEVVASDLAEKIKVISTMSTNTAIAAITGGTIDNTVIGGTTPAAGTFTTLTATGQTSLGGAAGANNFRILDTAGSVNYWNVRGGDGSTTSPRFTTDGTGTNIAGQFASKGTGAFQFLTGGTREQLRVSDTASAVNYVQVTGAATGARPTISAQGSDAAVDLNFAAKGIGGIYFQHFSVFGSGKFNNWTTDGAVTGLSPFLRAGGGDTNVSAVFQSKGTGAIDLAAGSSGVNISNGGTVTAITRTAAGTGYTSVPTVNITAPTTAGGVQAVITIPSIVLASPALNAGGTGYTVNDVLTLVGGTFTTAATLTVTAVSGGVITAVSIANNGVYTVAPSIPASVTGGTGTGATFNASFGINSNFSIGTAGSGYVEQPTITFSGGGGSGATAYATVGSIPTLKTIGSALSFSTPGGEQIRVVDTGTTADAYIAFKGGTASSGGTYITNTGTARDLYVSTGVAKTIRFFTNGEGSAEQFRVSHTASAVNYVQVTGAATGSGVAISSQGSDTSVGLVLQAKGSSGTIGFGNASGLNNQAFRVSTGTATNTGNLILVTGAASGSSPSISAISGTGGSDTNIDLTLTPKGTGVVQFGTYTATVTAVAGYILIKDSGGTTRKLAVLT